MSSTGKNQHILDVFFDGNCVLCNAEIELYRKKDIHEKIRWVDISASHFNAKKFGLDPIKVRRHMHAQSVAGERFVGVDAFVAIWQTLSVNPLLVQVVTNPFLRPVFDFGYTVFAKVRPYLPKKNKDCENGSCAI